MIVRKQKQFRTGREGAIVIVLMILTLPVWGQLKDTLFTPVNIWGLYYEIGNRKSTYLASKLGETGFSYHELDSTQLLVAGDPRHLPVIVKKGMRDGIKVGYTHSFQSDCSGVYQYSKVERNSSRAVRREIIDQFTYNASVAYIKFPHLYKGDSTFFINKARNEFINWLKKGKGQPPRPTNEVPFALVAVNKSEGQLTVDFERKGKSLVTLRMDTLYGRTPDYLPVVQDSCAPFNRFTEFYRLAVLPATGYPHNYHPGDRKVVRKEFQLEFGKNEVECAPSMLAPMIALMKDSNYTILSARVEGYASVEGTQEINDRLHAKRADVLLTTLNKYNDGKIHLDTVITRENWVLFQRQLIGTEFDWLLKLSPLEIKEKLKDEKLSSRLEPFLAEQRTARLTLMVGEKLSAEERLYRALTDLRTSIHLLCTKNQKVPNVISPQDRFLSVLDYLERKITSGELEKKVLMEALGDTEIVLDMLFIKSWYDWKKEKRISSVIPVDSVVLSAHKLHMGLFDKYVRGGRRVPGDCIDVGEYSLTRLSTIQQFLPILINRGILSADALFNIEYPDEQHFYGLTLDLLSLRRTFGYYSPRSSISEVEYDDGYNSGPSDPYYYMIKKIVLQKDLRVLEYVYRSDYYFFLDLFELLEANVKGWDVNKGFFYDDEITPEVMYSLMLRLRKETRICKREVDGLALELYRKGQIWYLSNGISTKEHEKNFKTGLDYISGYYYSNSAKFNPDVLESVARMLILCNLELVSRDGSRAAFRLLNAGRLHHEYNESQKLLFYRLSYYHDPAFLEKIKSWDKDLVFKIFNGKEGLFPFNPELVSLACKLGK